MRAIGLSGLMQAVRSGAADLAVLREFSRASSAGGFLQGLAAALQQSPPVNSCSSSHLAGVTFQHTSQLALEHNSCGASAAAGRLNDTATAQWLASGFSARSFATATAAAERDPRFSALTDTDVQRFRQILGDDAVITDPEALRNYNRSATFFMAFMFMLDCVGEQDVYVCPVRRYGQCCAPAGTGCRSMRAPVRSRCCRGQPSKCPRSADARCRSDDMS